MIIFYRTKIFHIETKLKKRHKHKPSALAQSLERKYAPTKQHWQHRRDKHQKDRE